MKIRTWFIPTGFEHVGRVSIDLNKHIRNQNPVKSILSYYSMSFERKQHTQVQIIAVVYPIVQIKLYPIPEMLLKYAIPKQIKY
jgi:hypothetical protein